MSFHKILLRRTKFWVNLTLAYFSRYKIWLLSFFFLCIFGTFFIYNTLPEIIRSDLITIGYVGDYTLKEIPTEILSLVTEPLIAVSQDLKPQPALASHWQVSEDGKTYTIFLKDDLTWHDSSKVLAKDITIAIDNVTINALNNKTIEIKLPNPISSFLLALNKPVFKKETFYGTGRYRIVAIDQIEGVVRKISLVSKEKNLPQIEIKFYHDEREATNALKIAEVKFATIPSSNQLQNWPNLEVEKITDFSEIITIFYNNQDPALSSKELRQALSYAINRQNTDTKQATGPISPMGWAYNQGVKRYEYNTGKAKELLSKVDTKNLLITLSVAHNLEDEALQIKSDWEAIGIKVNLIFEKNIPKNYQALLVINKLSPDPDQYSLWHSTQETNISRYKNVKVDKLLEDARQTQDENSRRQLYFDFQKFLVEDVPATFLYHPNKYQVVYKNAKSLIDKLPM